MKHPGHEEPFNKNTENRDRKILFGDGVGIPKEWDEAEEEARRLNERDANEPVEHVIAGGVTATKANVAKLLPPQSAPPVEGPSYREETEFNQDGTPNVNWSKE